MRPVSIKRFEILYLGAALVGLINTALSWNTASAQVAQSSPGAEAIAVPLLVGGTLISLLITGLLWYFTARRGSNIARWIVVIFFAIGVLSLIVTVPSGRFPTGLQGVIAIASFVMQAAAVVMLFQRDAVAWFKGDEAAAVDATTFE